MSHRSHLSFFRGLSVFSYIVSHYMYLCDKCFVSHHSYLCGVEVYHTRMHWSLSHKWSWSLSHMHTLKFITQARRMLSCILQCYCCKYCNNLPGGTVGYPAHPRLIPPSVRLSVCHITFNYSAENFPGPTDLEKYSLKNVNWRKLRVRYFLKLVFLPAKTMNSYR